jgi:hypothetical protein
MFKPGQSEKLKGRPPGVNDERIRPHRMITSRSEELVNKVVKMALAGEVTTMKLCLERVCPPAKQRDEPVYLELP